MKTKANDKNLSVSEMNLIHLTELITAVNIDN